ncbi:MAG TPA: hypothetical protein VN721_03800 [Flavipsychrobacter sp.]|nr:hypothetical protein [Flavipsychrobacter sp.]
MKLIRSHKAIFGNGYGIAVFIACIYFVLLGGFWFFEALFTTEQFSYGGFVMMVIFLVQLFLRRKLANLILGVIVLFFSIWFFLISSSEYPSSKVKSDVPIELIWIGLTISITSIIMSGILIFSYFKAHTLENK